MKEGGACSPDFIWPHWTSQALLWQVVFSTVSSSDSTASQPCLTSDFSPAQISLSAWSLNSLKDLLSSAVKSSCDIDTTKITYWKLMCCGQPECAGRRSYWPHCLFLMKWKVSGSADIYAMKQLSAAGQQNAGQHKANAAESNSVYCSLGWQAVFLLKSPWEIQLH